MSEENGEAITILIDARHSCRKNAKDTNVVCIGNKTYEVRREEPVTRERDAITQRHEFLGTRRLFDYFDSYISSLGCPVRISKHVHDRNASLNTFIREERLETLNQSDTWHAAKSLENEISKVGKGSRKTMELLGMNNFRIRFILSGSTCSLPFRIATMTPTYSRKKWITLYITTRIFMIGVRPCGR